MMRTSRPGYRVALTAALPLMFTVLVISISGERPASASMEAANPKVGAAQTAQTLAIQDGGDWSPLHNTMDVPVHISLLPDGRLLYWGRDKADVIINDTGQPGSDNLPDWDETNKCKTYLSDPLYVDDSGYTEMKPNMTTNLFCSGHSFLPDGRLLVAGGHHRVDPYYSTEGIGEKTLNIFDYKTNTWTTSQTQIMTNGRWYPFNVTLANGETLIMSGTYWDGSSFTGSPPKPKTVANYEPSIRELDGDIRTLHAGEDGNYDAGFQYPYLSLTPDNKVFNAKPSRSKSSSSLANRMLDPYAPNPITGGPGVFQAYDPPHHTHWEGTSVQYAPGKVLVLGGALFLPGQEQSKLADVFDTTQPTLGWQPVGSLTFGRMFPTATLLPDGKVLVTGGTQCQGYNRVDCPNGPVHTPEMWDPATPSVWQQMNPAASGETRVYHSIAMLMPDGRVMVGGGGLPAATGELVSNGQGETTNCQGTTPDNDPVECRSFGHKNVEFYSPPYLFDASGNPARRPAITFAPDNIAYGQQIVINVGNVDRSTIKKVVLIRLPSVTHTYNEDQRRVDLGAPAPASGDNNISVNAPLDGKACPPGPYMMFLIGDNGPSVNRTTVSVAKIVRVGDFSITSATSRYDNGRTFPPASPTPMGGTINVAASSSVPWTAQIITSGSSWVTIQGGSGMGNGSVSFTVAPNAGQQARLAKIRFAVTGRDDTGIEYVVYQAGNFTDVPQGSTYYTWASKIYARGVTGGCSSAPFKFCPEDTLTRGQGAVFISALLHPQPLPSPRARRFPDVPTTHGFARFIEYVARRKIVESCNMTGNFCIDQPLTRKYMVVWLLRGLGVDNPPNTGTSSFADISPTDPASPFIEEAVRRNITSGCGGGNFCPDEPVRRGQMAVFFSQTFGL
jgi:Domain of unknown function (DUF1929)/S-layer homology domain/Putative binding domain, N-terminal